jgi:hypothetical protein
MVYGCNHHKYKVHAHNFTVNQLMLPNRKIWDKKKIESLFPLDVANNILDIPLWKWERMIS